MDHGYYPDICQDPGVSEVLDAAREKWERLDDAYRGLEHMLIHDFDSGKPIHPGDEPLILFKRGPGPEVDEAPIFRALCVLDGEHKIIIRHLDIIFPEDW